MADLIPDQRADRTQLQQIIIGLTEGIPLSTRDQTISWANDAALSMHGVGSIADLGATIVVRTALRIFPKFQQVGGTRALRHLVIRRVFGGRNGWGLQSA
jgi:hypothetical protein